MEAEEGGVLGVSENAKSNEAGPHVPSLASDRGEGALMAVTRRASPYDRIHEV